MTLRIVTHLRSQERALARAQQLRGKHVPTITKSPQRGHKRQSHSGRERGVLVWGKSMSSEPMASTFARSHPSSATGHPDPCEIIGAFRPSAYNIVACLILPCQRAPGMLLRTPLPGAVLSRPPFRRRSADPHLEEATCSTI
jgi:hypothetical protein